MLRLIYLLDKGMSVGDFFSVLALIIPSLIFSILPLITLLSSVFVYNRLSDERQILILKACGLSDISIAVPAIYVAIAFTFVHLLISAYIMPVSHSHLKKQMVVLRNSYISSIIEVRKFNQISQDTTIYIENRDNEKNLYGLVLFDNRDPDSKSVTFAKHGVFSLEDGDAFFRLNEGVRQAYDTTGNITRLYFDSLSIKIEKEELVDTRKNKSSLELFIDQMLFPDQELSEDQQNKLKSEGHLRIIWPLFNLAFTLLGISFFLKIRFRRGHSVGSLLAGFLPVIIAAFIHFTLQKFSYSNPNVIFLCYANVLACIMVGIWNCRRKVI